MFEACGIRDDVLNEEALLTIHSVINNPSFKFNANKSAWFKVIFPNFPIANETSLMEQTKSHTHDTPQRDGVNETKPLARRTSKTW